MTYTLLIEYPPDTWTTRTGFPKDEQFKTSLSTTFPTKLTPNPWISSEIGHRTTGRHRGSRWRNRRSEPHGRHRPHGSSRRITELTLTTRRLSTRIVPSEPRRLGRWRRCDRRGRLQVTREGFLEIRCYRGIRVGRKWIYKRSWERFCVFFPAVIAWFLGVSAYITHVVTFGLDK